ncbi:MAG TPA: hypothetical protein VFY03_13795 [Woeseiaceae bacterium]|nr:hypothetical protein [Woeseiaceae bacterium]
MTIRITPSIVVLAAVATVAFSDGAAQDDSPQTPPAGQETWTPDAERVLPDAEREPARPEQVEETIEEVLDPEFDPTTTPDDDADSVDTDSAASGPPTDDRLAEKRIERTLGDGPNPGIDEVPEDEEGLADPE